MEQLFAAASRIRLDQAAPGGAFPPDLNRTGCSSNAPPGASPHLGRAPLPPAPYQLLPLPSCQYLPDLKYKATKCPDLCALPSTGMPKLHRFSRHWPRSNARAFTSQPALLSLLRTPSPSSPSVHSTPPSSLAPHPPPGPARQLLRTLPAHLLHLVNVGIALHSFCAFLIGQMAPGEPSSKTGRHYGP